MKSVGGVNNYVCYFNILDVGDFLGIVCFCLFVYVIIVVF